MRFARRLVLLLLLAAPLPGVAQDLPTHGEAGVPRPPSAVFAEAFQLFTDGHYGQALANLDAFREAHPQSPLVADALFYGAQAALALERDEEAARRFELLRSRYPLHPLTDQAQEALGRYYFEAGRYAEARTFYTRFLDTQPSPEAAATALYGRGQAALGANDPQAALADFQQIGARYRETEVAPAALYAEAQTLVALGRLDQAASAYETLAARYPDSGFTTDVGLALAEVYYELGDYRRTVQEAEQRLRQLPEDSPARERATFLLAESYNQLRNSEDAIRYYRRFTEGNPESPYYRQALYGLAWNYHFEGAYEWAADHFAQVRNAGMGDDLAHRALYYQAANRKLQGLYEPAMDAWELLLEEAPDHPLAAPARYELALGFYERQQWNEANAMLQQYVDRHPNGERIGDALRYLGATYVALGDFPAAQRAFDRAIETGAAPPTLAYDIRFQQAWLRYRTEEYEAAEEAFLQLHERFPEAERAGDALFWAAESAYQQDAYARAEELFSAYLDAYPSGAKTDAALYALGWTHFRRGRYAEAATYFQRFLDGYREAPDDATSYRTDALLRLGDSYYALKRFGEAAQVYSRVDGAGAEYARYQQAQARYNQGDYGRALVAFQDLVRTYPEGEYGIEARYRIAYIRFQQDQYEEAIDAYRALMAAYPDQPIAARAQYGIGDALFNAGQFEEAIEAYAAVLEDYPRSNVVSDAASSLLLSFAALGDPARADRFLREFESRHPNSPLVDELRFRQAEVAYQSGNEEEALRLLQRFVRSTSNENLLPDAYFYLGTIYAQRGGDEAEAYLQQVVESERQHPRRAEAAALLGRYYVNRERYADALAAYEALEASRSNNPLLLAQARYGQSQALLALGRTGEAEALLRGSIGDVSPDSPAYGPLQLGLARLYEQQGEAERALRFYREVARSSTDETGAEALYRLGALLLEQDRPVEAIEVLGPLTETFASEREWVAQGLLTQARALAELGRTGDATALYQQVEDTFVGTPYAATARSERTAL